MSIFRSLYAKLSKNDKKLDVDLSDFEKPFALPINHCPAFIVGTGRNGTHFFAKLLEQEPSLFSVHLDTINRPEADSLIPYTVWYKLPIDFLPFKEYRRRLILYASNQNKKYCESNPYLSLICDKLFEWFDAKIILLLRNPENVINSHYVKGWYQTIPPRSDFNVAPGFWPDLTANQFFGRLMPTGEEFTHWKNLTRIGKISWWWNTLNTEVLKLLDTIPENNYRVVKIESFDYNAYKNLCDFMNFKGTITKDKFEKIRHKRPGKGRSNKSSDTWSELERREYNEITEKLRKRLDYL